MCNKFKKRLLSTTLAVLMLSGAVTVPVSVSADEVSEPTNQTVTQIEAGTYNSYIEGRDKISPAKDDITLNATSAVVDNEDVLLRDKDSIVCKGVNISKPIPESVCKITEKPVA